MPASTAALGFNAKFGIKSGSTYTYVAEVNAITPPGWTRDAVEVTHLTSDGGWKEFIAGLKEGSEASFTINYLPSVTDTLVTAFLAGIGDFRILAPSGTVGIDFKGVMLNFSPADFTGTEKMTAGVTVKPTGPVTLSAVVA